MTGRIAAALEFAAPLVLPAFVSPAVCAFLLAYIGMTNRRIGIAARVAFVGTGAAFAVSLLWLGAALSKGILGWVPSAYALLVWVAWAATMLWWAPRVKVAHKISKEYRR